MTALEKRVADLEAGSGGGTTPHTHPELEETPAVEALNTRVSALEAGSGGGGGGSLPSGTVGNLTVRGELTVYATNSPASRAINIVNPKGSQYDQGYPMIRWEREQSDGSRQFLYGLVTHEKATDGSVHNHHSHYRRTSDGGRESFFDADFGVAGVGGSPRPYLDIEETEVRLSKGSKLFDRNGNEILG
jgi:hypothetical protein